MGQLTKYQTIVLDPPWKYGKWGKGSSKSAFAEQYQKDMPLPYSYMEVSEIARLPISNLAAENCEVYLWVTQKYLPESFPLLKKWGLKYCQTLTWCKKPMGKGQGGVYTPTTEFLILARRGKMPKVERVDSTWFLVKRQSRHSQKPDEFLALIETVTKGPRLEMFARRKRAGCDVFGNEVKQSIDLAPYGWQG